MLLKKLMAFSPTSFRAPSSRRRRFNSMKRSSLPDTWTAPPLNQTAGDFKEMKHMRAKEDTLFKNRGSRGLWPPMEQDFLPQRPMSQGCKDPSIPHRIQKDDLRMFLIRPTGIRGKSSFSHQDWASFLRIPSTSSSRSRCRGARMRTRRGVIFSTLCRV